MLHLVSDILCPKPSAGYLCQKPGNELNYRKSPGKCKTLVVKENPAKILTNWGHFVLPPNPIRLKIRTAAGSDLEIWGWGSEVERQDKF